MTNGKQPKVRIAPPSRQRFEDRVRAITSRRRGLSIERMVRELNRYLQGWFGYFRLSKTTAVHRGLDTSYFTQLGLFNLTDQWRQKSQAV